MVIGMNPNDVSQLDDVGFSFFPVMVDYLTMVCVENSFYRSSKDLQRVCCFNAVNNRFGDVSCLVSALFVYFEMIGVCCGEIHIRDFFSLVVINHDSQLKVALPLIDERVAVRSKLYSLWKFEVSKGLLVDPQCSI